MSCRQRCQAALLAELESYCNCGFILLIFNTLSYTLKIISSVIWLNMRTACVRGAYTAHTLRMTVPVLEAQGIISCCSLLYTLRLQSPQVSALTCVGGKS
jgi:hypothetical protein